MKILVTGASGLLGTKIVKLTSNFEIYATYYQNPINFDDASIFRLDIREINTANLIGKISPDLVVHTAAFTNVDGCEIDRKKAY